MTTAVGTRKFSQVATKFQVGTAALAVVAAATLTPPIAHATPSIVPFAQGLGDSVNTLIIVPFATPGTHGGNKVVPTLLAGAVTSAGPIQNFITGLVQTVAGWFYAGFTFVANAIQVVANAIAYVFKVGPYATSSGGAAS